MSSPAQDFWHSDPRAWSPRLKPGLQKVRQLHDLFPKYMLQVYGDTDFRAGLVHWRGTPSGRQDFLLTFTVTFEPLQNFTPNPNAIYNAIYTPGLMRDGVWITQEGTLDVGQYIEKMLKEGLRGYESLAGRWPWPEKINSV